MAALNGIFDLAQGCEVTSVSVTHRLAEDHGKALDSL